MNMFLVTAVAAASVMTAVFVRKNTPEISLLLSITAAVLTMLFAMEGLYEVLDEAEAMMSGMNSDYFTVPAKALGIGLLTAVTVRLCDDAGDKALSFTVNFSGKVAMIVSALPLFEELLNIMSGILKTE